MFISAGSKAKRSVKVNFVTLAWRNFAKIEAFNSVLRRRPDGGDLAEQICSLLLDHYGSSAKPVLLLRRNGNHWLGMLDYCPESRERSHRISHLHRCLAAS